MTPKTFCTVASLVFAIVALAQVTRAALGWDLIIGGLAIPVWASWLAFVLAATLSVLGFRAAKTLA